LVLQLRIGIRGLQKCGFNTDPHPQPWRIVYRVYLLAMVMMGEEGELQAKVVALINRQLGDGLAGAPLIAAYRDQLEAKRRCVETRYDKYVAVCFNKWESTF